jgi:hypothetical protein
MSPKKSSGPQHPHSFSFPSLKHSTQLADSNQALVIKMFHPSEITCGWLQLKVLNNLLLEAEMLNECPLGPIVV